MNTDFTEKQTANIEQGKPKPSSATNMRTIRNIVLAVNVVIGCLAFSTASDNFKHPSSPSEQVPIDKLRDDSGIKMRIYVRSPAAFANERYHVFIVRVENRSGRVLPILTDTLPDSHADVVSFTRQTWDEALRGIGPKLKSWADILKQADRSLASGQAMEFRSGFTPGVMLPSRGRSRLVLQTGENSVVYSNWLDLTVETGTTDRVIADVQLTWDKNYSTEFSSVDTPSGKWVCERRLYKHHPLWQATNVTKVCFMPNGEIPTITPDIDRRQAAIEFPKHPKATVYFGALVGWGSCNPWPVGHIGADLHEKTIPVDGDSILGFPRELFKQ